MFSPSTPGGSRSRRRKRLRETVQHLAQDDSSSGLTSAPARYCHSSCQFTVLIIILLHCPLWQHSTEEKSSCVNFCDTEDITKPVLLMQFSVHT